MLHYHKLIFHSLQTTYKHKIHVAGSGNPSPTAIEGLVVYSRRKLVEVQACT